MSTSRHHCPSHKRRECLKPSMRTLRKRHARQLIRFLSPFAQARTYVLSAHYSGHMVLVINQSTNTAATMYSRCVSVEHLSTYHRDPVCMYIASSLSLVLHQLPLCRSQAMFHKLQVSLPTRVQYFTGSLQNIIYVATFSPSIAQYNTHCNIPSRLQLHAFPSIRHHIMPYHTINMPCRPNKLPVGFPNLAPNRDVYTHVRCPDQGLQRYVSTFEILVRCMVTDTQVIVVRVW